MKGESHGILLLLLLSSHKFGNKFVIKLFLVHSALPGLSNFFIRASFGNSNQFLNYFLFVILLSVFLIFLCYCLHVLIWSLQGELGGIVQVNWV